MLVDITTQGMFRAGWRLIRIRASRMANGGWFGTREEWRRLEAPLLEVDPVIDAFAGESGLAVTRNNKDWPERSIAWGDEIRCLIQLYLADPAGVTFNLWICASADRGGKRYWKQETPIRQQRLPEFRQDLPSRLLEAREQLLAWSRDRDCLEPVATPGTSGDGGSGGEPTRRA